MARISFLAIFFSASISLASAQLTHLELPNVAYGQHITGHSGYHLLYDEGAEQAAWVAYELSGWQVDGSWSRTDNFRSDETIATGSAELIDYKGSGYDRGHLMPAADAGWSEQSMSDSFFLSNMSPQAPGFNRGIWKTLEEKVRAWAKENGTVYIVTGPALKRGSIGSIGPDHVTVPRYFYKVILDYSTPELKAIGFILPNRKSNQPLGHFAVSVDSVEAFTGIDFYPALPDYDEEVIESNFNPRLWHLNTTQSTLKVKSVDKVQCHGNTKSGRRCKRMTSNTNGYCWQHQSQADVQ